jgi:hypothetical protein
MELMEEPASALWLMGLVHHRLVNLVLLKERAFLLGDNLRFAFLN